MDDLVPVFDGHNDVLLRLANRKDKPGEVAFLEGTRDGQLDLPRARRGGLVGGLFAVFPPSPGNFRFDSFMTGDGYDVPLPDVLTRDAARTSTLAMVALLLRIERAGEGAVSICRSAGEVRGAIARGSLATVLHVEGAEAIDPDFAMLDVLYAAGLRSLGPVWSRPNIFGHGVPFRFPSGPDIGPGLTEEGKALVKACNARRILVDVSHLNEKGFWDVAAVTDAPIVATHSNVHALCASARNLTDRQLAAIRESDGMVGLNFATAFLRPDGQMRADTDLEHAVRHVDALIEAVGETRVGFGSDFDGAIIPAAIGSAAGLPVLIEALEKHGYDRPLLTKIGTENWLRVLEKTIG